MSTKAIREVLEHFAAEASFPESPRARLAAAARAEVEAIEKAARDMTRLHAGDFVYNIREYEHVLNAPGDSWHHPDVKAWSDASVLLCTIAKEAK